ncbi:MAG: hypothetical protein R3E09_11275 [Novosphingobium sp.]
MHQKEPISTQWTHANIGNTGEGTRPWPQPGRRLVTWTKRGIPGFENGREPEGSNQVMPELQWLHMVLVGADGQRRQRGGILWTWSGCAVTRRNEVNTHPGLGQ